MDQRAAERCGEILDVLVEEELGDGRYSGRAAHQAPEVDGTTEVHTELPIAVGDMVRATVTGSSGVDLLAEAIEPAGSGPARRTGTR
jgi:tRNA A37 methylthiotransferase MiaB